MRSPGVRRDPGERVRRSGRAPVASRSLMASRIARARPGSPPPETATWTPSGPLATAGTCAAESAARSARTHQIPRVSARAATAASTARSPVAVCTSHQRSPSRSPAVPVPAVAPWRGGRPGRPGRTGREVVGCGLPGAPRDCALRDQVGEVLADRRRDHGDPRPGRDEAERPTGSHGPATDHQGRAPGQVQQQRVAAGRPGDGPRWAALMRRACGPCRRPRWPRSGRRSAGTPRWSAPGRRGRTRPARPGGSGPRRCR